MDFDRSVSALSEVLVTLAIFAVGIAILEGVLYLVLARWLKWKLALPILLIAPALVGLLALIVYPLLWELNVSFTNMSLNRLCDPGFPAGVLAECRGQPMFVGLDNYVRVFTSSRSPAFSRCSGRRSCGPSSTSSST
jgi:arabinogalactan oligomer / maltooligosaccharide transport system permease protein